MRRTSLLFGIVLLLLTAGFFGGLVVASRLNPPESERAAASTSPAPAASREASPDVQAARPAPLPAGGALPDLSPVAEAALKVAANISSTNLVQRRSPWPFFFDDTQVMRSQSLGSGVIVSPDGLILTNTHVIGDPRADVRVTLADGRERPATIVGVDYLSDLTVLKVQATALPTLSWGDSSKLRVAEWVLAIGNPFQMNGTVTLGIVSAVSRTQGGAYTDFIQTDAAINPGNSGGALINARGELVGINTQIVSETGGFQGIGLAIPSNLARQIMQELVKNGSVSWGSIGYVRLVDPDTARQYGWGNIGGLLVYQIQNTSAAYRGGLRPEDVIVSFNGQKTPDIQTLDRLVAQARPGERATVVVDRNGRQITLEIPIESRQQQRLLRRQ
ncbi:MAG: trypsin-like peptidase domain-containing protein [Acidobacteria bacterium]|nr:trypsin-like peptidase domain-containing protein [Acidobacteriota bacterium]